MTDTQTIAYAAALEIARYNTLSLLAMAQWAYEHRKDKESMTAASAVWERNARHLAKAVEYFGLFDKDYANIYTPNQFLSMFAIAALPKDRAAILAKKWQDETMAYWQVRQWIDEHKGK